MKRDIIKNSVLSILLAICGCLITACNSNLPEGTLIGIYMHSSGVAGFLYGYEIQGADPEADLGERFMYVLDTMDNIIPVGDNELKELDANMRTGLETLTLPETINANGTKFRLTAIGEGALSFLQDTETIVLPSSIKTIGAAAFSNCKMLKKINIPTGVTSIGLGAFLGCKSLLEITIPDNVNTIERNTFLACDDLKTVTLPKNLLLIQDNAFYDCYNLSEIIIPDNVDSIRRGTFENCRSLTNIHLPESLRIIDMQAFDGCSKLPTIEIPSSIESIGHSAFSGCRELTSVKCYAETPPALGNYAFASNNGYPIYVPKASLDAYKAAWPAYVNRLQPM